MLQFRFCAGSTDAEREVFGGNRMKTLHKIIIGDSRTMKEVPDQSVHLVVTSPPYWQLKDYGDERQIGFHDSYEEYK